MRRADIDPQANVILAPKILLGVPGIELSLTRKPNTLWSRRLPSVVGCTRCRLPEQAAGRRTSLLRNHSMSCCQDHCPRHPNTSPPAPSPPHAGLPLDAAGSERSATVLRGRVQRRVLGPGTRHTVPMLRIAHGDHQRHAAARVRQQHAKSGGRLPFWRMCTS